MGTGEENGCAASGTEPADTPAKPVPVLPDGRPRAPASSRRLLSGPAGRGERAEVREARAVTPGALPGNRERRGGVRASGRLGRLRGLWSCGGACSADAPLPAPGLGLRDGRAREREEAAAPARVLRLPRGPYPPIEASPKESGRPAAAPTPPARPRPPAPAPRRLPPRGPVSWSRRPRRAAPLGPPPRRHGLGVGEGGGALPPHEPAGVGAELPACGDGGLRARPVLHPEPGRRRPAPQAVHFRRRLLRGPLYRADLQRNRLPTGGGEDAREAASEDPLGRTWGTWNHSEGS